VCALGPGGQTTVDNARRRGFRRVELFFESSHHKKEAALPPSGRGGANSAETPPLCVALNCHLHRPPGGGLKPTNVHVTTARLSGLKAQVLVIMDQVTQTIIAVSRHLHRLAETVDDCLPLTSNTLTSKEFGLSICLRCHDYLDLLCLLSLLIRSSPEAEEEQKKRAAEKDAKQAGLADAWGSGVLA
jgi:hypothetical protein